jgi:hypothetical protein
MSTAVPCLRETRTNAAGIHTQAILPITALLGVRHLLRDAPMMKRPQIPLSINSREYSASRRAVTLGMRRDVPKNRVEAG